MRTAQSSKRRIVTLMCSILVTNIANAHTNNLPVDQHLYDLYPFSLLYYYGVTVNDPLLKVITLHNLQRWPEYVQSIELAYTLDEDNVLRHFLSPLVGVVQVAGNITLRNGRHQNQIYELDPYLIFRWANWRWNDTVVTSFAIAEGVSYDTSISSIEKRDNDNTKRFLNYLMLEATFAAPSYPRLQAVARIHHRSGAYGLYHAGNTGSNDIGLAIRYLFD